ncbi:MAG: universal stress protein [Solirubrobacteraceae bacterium]
MALSIIVSYDGTTHDDDALVLGRMLAKAGATLSLAYVRHSREYDPRREEIGQHDAERRLEQGATWLGDASVTRHIVVDPSTSAGLAKLAESESADLVIFGSDYRTPPGHVEPGGSAQGLLNGGAVAVGVAAAGLRIDQDAAIKTIGASGDGAAGQTAEALAPALGAEVVSGVNADLILVDSRNGGPAGHVELDGATRARLDSARGSVLVLPGGSPLSL